MEVDAIRDSCHEVLGDDDELGVIRVAGTRTRDAVADAEGVHFRADCSDDPRAGIAQGLWYAQSCSSRLGRWIRGLPGGVCESPG